MGSAEEAYRIVRAIGSGGTAEIFEALARDDTKVAIKQFTEEAIPGDRFAQFLDDARVLMLLAHPGIPAVIDYGISDGRAFLVMELVEGVDAVALEDLAGAAGEVLSVEVALSIAAQAATALDSAHHALDHDGRPLSIVHGDVSPENLLISWTGVTKLTDFNVGFDGKKQRFSAPERRLGGPADPKGDVYALAKTLEVLLGDERTPAIREALEGALAEAPEERPSAGGFAAALYAILASLADQDPVALTKAFVERLRPAPVRAGSRAASPNLLAIPKLITGSLAASGDRPAQDKTKVQARIQEPAPEPSPAPAQSLIGTVIHGFVIEELLAHRPLSSLYRARHQLFAREYAVKVISREVSQDPAGLERFKREALLLSKLEHPNVVRASDFGTTPHDELFIAMEMLSGETLRDVIKQYGPLSHARAAMYTRQIASALEAAHQLGIVHRDVKPSNVMISGDHATLIDFGIARQGASDARDRLTQTGQLIGTPAYMAPEQIVGVAQLGPPADLYALGCLLYEVLAGGPPFGKNPLVAMDGHLYRSPPALPDCGGLERIAYALLAKRPEARPKSAAEVIAMLDALGSPRPQRREERRGRKPLVLALVALAVLAMPFAGYLIFRSESPPPVAIEEVRVIAEPIAIPRKLAPEEEVVKPEPAKAGAVKKREPRKVIEPPEPARTEDPPPPAPAAIEVEDLRRAIAAIRPKIERLAAAEQPAFDSRYLDLRSAIHAKMTESERARAASRIEALGREVDARLAGP